MSTSFIRKKKSGRLFKIALLGDGGVGKTALKERFLGKGFESSYLMTIGADFATYSSKIQDEDVKLQIWDLAGQSRFAEVRSGFYQGTLGALLVYDVTRKESAENLINWVAEVKKYSGNENLSYILVANKIDLRKAEPGSLTKRQGQAITKKIAKAADVKSVHYVETSAKDNINVPQAFLDLAEVILSSISKKSGKDEKFYES